MVAIKLMEHEVTFPVTECTPTTSVSFYQRNVGADQENALTFIKSRFTQVLKANPWLIGRLVKQKHQGQTGVYLSYEEDIPSIDEYFTIMDDDKVFELTNWSDLIDYLYPLKPKSGKECINKDEKLCQLILFRNSDLSKLALMFSLNHSIGDGSTCYRIWKMLDKEESVESMVVERFHELDEAVQRQTNLQPLSEGTADDIKLLLSMVGRGLKRKFCKNTPPNGFMYRVEADQIANRKREHNSDDSFVSTNDILSTEILGAYHQADGVRMVVNVRERIPELHKNMAGNYVALCSISFKEIETARDFRDRWTRILRKELPADAVDKVGNASANWLTLYHQVEVPGFSHHLHLPVFSPCDFCETIIGIPLAIQCGIIPFRLHNQQVGIALSVYNDVITEEYLEKCKLLGDKVSLIW